MTNRSLNHRHVLHDEAYMQLALELAAAARGQTDSNPIVGCVIVKDGRIVGLGSHLRRGEAHAEVHALKMAGGEARGSTVYVTLEPCSHRGRTPPCAKQLIEAGVKRIVAACRDPNPLVSGRGLKMLQEHGIETEVGVLEEQALQLNEHFFTYVAKGRPFITLKTASTLDGKVASYTGDSRWITNEEARAYVHTLRHQHQAIMVGIGTVLADDPSLTVRAPVPGVHPIRIIVDSQLRTPLHAKVVQDGLAETIILTTERADKQAAARLEQAGVTVIACGDGKRVDLPLAMQKLAEREIASILLEGGGTLNGAMLAHGLIDKMVLFYAPKIIGGAEAPANFQMTGIEKMADAYRLERVQIETFGDNVGIIGYPVYPRREA
ncbi:bifunctional diaminohydroxyphosphoribosylaminopyrimidine deaminase/5-amino-6-(5-phosphoribosylamino)uracil reductase RibD [Insulibacter thermoxylanivorax]|uniref:bifunctional diaminohydroxyphosphoribosylaminopyrimidine deaminase/5-amino-6-(5-phosphoribosylamino)uracil reductase RibD n=1 Tax=Insulibacter thermoxylanivorax TaxID=2749268 RepID=UPI0019100E7B|nr:bifunctional diaminohydroxyphosphoribosylaminopyrimidine deaminase/5-amino-6-(5-phosphoribosylamino)uracil reductase RibD [Insulibacter thermoxylanivorax]